MNNGGSDPRGRIWLFWDHIFLTVDVLVISDQYIHVRVSDLAAKSSYLLTVVYGRNNRYDRRKLWSDLCSFNIGNEAWILSGDFNTCTDLEDKIGGNRLKQSDIIDIKDFLYSQELDDLPAKGGFYTWSNKSTNSIRRTLTKIDRCFINPQWRRIFSNSFVELLPPGISDHAPMVIQWGKAGNNPRSFKYFNHWADHVSFKPLIESIWSTPMTGNPMMRFTSKLKLVKNELKLWSRRHFSNISERLVDAKQTLDRIQAEIQARPLDTQLAQMELDASNSYLELAQQEEASLYQMAKKKDALLGDGNNSYFHNLVKGRKSINTILSIRNMNGVMLSEDEDVVDAFLGYYKHLLAEEHSNILQSDDLDSMHFPPL
ncbi:Dnase i-like superfamily protein, partial [Thalictrum thalictroides]